MEQAGANSTLWICLSNLHSIAKSFSTVSESTPVHPVPPSTPQNHESEDRQIRFNVAFSDAPQPDPASRKSSTNAKKNLQSRSDYEKRAECVEYLRWLLQMNDRFEGITEETEAYLSKFQQHQAQCDHVDYLAIKEGNQVVKAIDEFIQTEFIPLHIYSLDACDKFSPQLLKLVYPPEDTFSLCSINHVVWQTWCTHKPSGSLDGEIPSLRSLFEGINGFLQAMGVLLEEHSSQEVGSEWNSDDEGVEEYSTSERVQAANDSYQYALGILEQATQIEQIAIQILGSAASHRVDYSGQIFITLASPLYILLDRQFQEESDRQRVDITSARTQFPQFLKSLDRLFLNSWLLLSALLRHYQRQQVTKNGKKEPHTSLEFLYGKIYPKLMSNSGGRTGSKKMKLFPGVESKTVMTVVKRMWGKMDSHLTLCLQNFSLRSAKGNQYDAGSLRILFLLLQHLAEFFGSAGGPLFPLYHQCVQNNFHKVRTVYTVLKEFQSLQFISKLFCDQIGMSITPDHQYWSSYCRSTVWKEGSPAEDCVSQFKALFTQCSLLLVGSKGTATAQIASYLTAAIDVGVNHPAYRETVQHIQSFLTRKVSEVSLDICRTITSSDTHPTVDKIVLAHCKNTLQQQPSKATTPSSTPTPPGTTRSKMLQMV